MSGMSINRRQILRTRDWKNKRRNTAINTDFFFCGDTTLKTGYYGETHLKLDKSIVRHTYKLEERNERFI